MCCSLEEVLQPAGWGAFFCDQFKGRLERSAAPMPHHRRSSKADADVIYKPQLR